MVTAPADIPVTIPVSEPIVAFAIELLVHTPPGEASVNVVVEPSHTLTGPAGFMGKGLAFTVTVANA